MSSLPRFLAIFGILLHIAVTLPRITSCDTSYYEKYYSARRYTPPKKSLLTMYTFSVDMGVESLHSFEKVALVGDHKNLGSWSAQGAILLNRTEQYNVWQADVYLPDNITVNYRYFVSSVNRNTGTRQVRRWESHITARTFNTASKANRDIDVFGIIAYEGGESQREVERGWLNVGRIIQFKLFRAPLTIAEPIYNNESMPELRIKLQPLDRASLTPLLPSARIFIEYVKMSFGDSILRAQPEFGVSYKNNDIVMFHATIGEVADLENIAFAVQLYATEVNGDAIRLLGYQYVYADAIVGSEGSFDVKLISPVWLSTIGNLGIQYLVIDPLPGPPTTPVSDFHSTFVDYWRDEWVNLDVGHRGLGKTFKPIFSTQPPATENTLAAMKASNILGADMAEFDVQLTSDLIPIIYHNFEIYVCLNSKTPTSAADLTTVYIKDVTHEQLKNLKTYQIINNKVVEYPAHNNVESVDQRLFPTFEEFLTDVNKTLGYDIEIKWPQTTILGTPESVQTIDKNVFIDRILGVMLKHGCGRFSFFTSFDADICTMLRFKQNMYPVLLLQSDMPYYADPRTDGIYDTLNTAQAFDFAGIVPHGERLKQQTDLVELANKINKKVLFWGDLMKDKESIAWFEEKKPAGLIYDRLDLWLPADKKSAFDVESDLPDFFQLQCTPQTIGGDNSTAEGILSNVTFW